MKIRRREFIGGGVSASLAAMLGPDLMAENMKDIEDSSGALPRRTLGKTGEKLSIVGLGAISIMRGTQQEANELLAEAFDRGAACTGDINAADHLSLAPRPIREVREQFGVRPLSEPMLADDDPAYEVLSVRGTILVEPESGVVIPRFGGEVGDVITFDLGGGAVGECTLTGVFPDGR